MDVQGEELHETHSKIELWVRAVNAMVGLWD